MGSKGMLMVNMFFSPKARTSACTLFNLGLGQNKLSSPFFRRNIQQSNSSSCKNQTIRNFSVGQSGLEPPDIARLAETARISLTPDEVQEFGPKIKEVISWFGQLEDVDLENIEPALRAGIGSDPDMEGLACETEEPKAEENLLNKTEADNIRVDMPETFANRESIISALPSFEEPYVKVPKVLNKE